MNTDKTIACILEQYTYGISIDVNAEAVVELWHLIYLKLRYIITNTDIITR